MANGSRTDLTGITSTVAEHVVGLSYDQIPGPVVEKAKQVVLDALGCQLACSQLPHGEMAIDFARRQAGRPDATVNGSEFKTGVEHAALVNGILGHGDEIDEPRHRSAVLLPAVLAAGERERVSGQEAIVALVAGYDVLTRLSKAGLDLDGLAPRNFQEGSVPGSLAAAAAVGRLLQLSPQEMQAAMGLGAEQSCGLQAMRLESGHMNKSFHMGVGARNGVTAAYLAQLGYGSGVLTILEPPYSIFQAFIPDGSRPEEMIRDLGGRWDILDTGFKKYSAGRPIHAAIASVIKVVEENHLAPGDIERITVKLPSLERRLLSASRTLNVNIEYIVAVAAIDREVAWEQFDDAHQNDPAVKALWSRTTSQGDPELDAIKASGIGARPAGIDLTTYDGRRFSEQMLFPPGHPENPLSNAELEAKFRYWSTHAISAAQAGDLLAAIRNLDRITDVNEIGDLLRVG